MNARRRAALVRAFLLLLALLALSRLIRGHDLRQALALIRRVGWPLGLVVVPTLVAMGLDAAGWGGILLALGTRVRWVRMLELRLSVEALVLLLPGGSVAGEAAKMALLNRRAGVPLPRAVASLALTKGYLVATDGAYLALAAVWAALDAEAAGGSPFSLPALGAAACAVAMGLLGWLLLASLRHAAIASRIAALLQKIPILRLRRAIAERERGFAQIDSEARAFFAAPAARRWRPLLAFFLEWLMEGIETLIIVRCLRLPLPIGPVLALDALGSLLRVIVFFLPAGLGVQDAAIILLLRQMGLPNPVAAGTALILVKRAKELFWIAAGTVFLLIRGDLRRAATLGPAPGPPPDRSLRPGSP
ncbi:MAG TPA: lysylphosphatidylglycerol synthase domain-containing protein [Polyangia bacterium]|nr:lysylphosphatidylglycerol synthase domain-containing protein [Polyangia bacterium]